MACVRSYIINASFYLSTSLLVPVFVWGKLNMHLNINYKTYLHKSLKQFWIQKLTNIQIFIYFIPEIWWSCHITINFIHTLFLFNPGIHFHYKVLLITFIYSWPYNTYSNKNQTIKVVNKNIEVKKKCSNIKWKINKGDVPVTTHS
jgi:hypothetical protein